METEIKQNGPCVEPCDTLNIGDDLICHFVTYDIFDQLWEDVLHFWFHFIEKTTRRYFCKRRIYRDFTYLRNSKERTVNSSSKVDSSFCFALKLSTSSYLATLTFYVGAPSDLKPVQN